MVEHNKLYGDLVLYVRASLFQDLIQDWDSGMGAEQPDSPTDF